MKRFVHVHTRKKYIGNGCEDVFLVSVKDMRERFIEGQTDTVLIHHIIAKGTIDEDVMAALSRKEKIQNALINAVKAKLEVRA